MGWVLDLRTLSRPSGRRLRVSIGPPRPTSQGRSISPGLTPAVDLFHGAFLVVGYLARKFAPGASPGVGTYRGLIQQHMYHTLHRRTRTP